MAVLQAFFNDMGLEKAIKYGKKTKVVWKDFWKELIFYTTSIMTANDFCGTVRHRNLKSGSENRFEKGKETWQR